MQEQPQALERELRAAQAQIRDVGSVLRDALAEDDRLAALAATPPSNIAQGNGAPGDGARRHSAPDESGQAEGGWR